MNDGTRKVVVITGSARGIGFGVAREFLARGHRVVVSDLQQDAVDAALSELDGPDDAIGLSCNVTDASQLMALWEFAAASFGRVDIWINNAGVGSDQSDIIDTDPTLLQRVLDTNVRGVVYGTQVALRGMQDQGGPAAVYNVAGFGSDGFWRRGMTIYGTSKRAVAYFSRGVAKEMAGGDVIVGWLNPGMVVTPLVIEEARTMPAEKWAAGRKVFNMWGETIETTATQLVDKILDNRKNCVNLHLLPGWKMAWKSLRQLFLRRDLFSEHGV